MNKRMIPYGYRMENGILRTDAEESEVIRRIFRMRLEGTGVYAIGKTLYEEQLPFFSDSRDKTIKKVSCRSVMNLSNGWQPIVVCLRKKNINRIPTPLRSAIIPTSSTAMQTGNWREFLQMRVSAVQEQRTVHSSTI